MSVAMRSEAWVIAPPPPRGEGVGGGGLFEGAHRSPDWRQTRLRCRQAPPPRPSPQGGGERVVRFPSEIPLALLLLHRGGLVVVDDPALALGGGGEQHLLDDRRQGVR